MHLRLSSGEFVLVDGAFPLRGPALFATVNQSLNSKLSNAEDPTLRDELKGKAALVFSPWCWQPFIASSKEIVRLENLLWPIEIAKGSGTPELLLDQMGFGLPPQWNLDAETIYRGTCDLSTLHQHLGWRSKKLMEMVLAHPSVDQRRRRQSEHFTLLLCLQPFVSFGEFLKNQPRRSM